MAFARHRRERWYRKAIFVSLAVQLLILVVIWKRLPFSNGAEAAVVGILDATVCAYVFAKFGPPGLMPGR